MQTQMFYPLRGGFGFMVEMKVEILDTTSFKPQCSSHLYAPPTILDLDSGISQFLENLSQRGGSGCKTHGVQGVLNYFYHYFVLINDFSQMG